MITSENLAGLNLRELLEQEKKNLNRNGQPTSDGSASDPDGIKSCPVCGKECKGSFGLQAHMKAHKGQEPGEITPDSIPVKKAAKPSQKELKELQEDLATNIKTVGQILHPLLLNLKVIKLQDPDARIRIPNTKIYLPIPDFDTHLPYTLISRSELTAEVLTKYAEGNENLLKWLVRFNSWFKGGQTGSLVGAHIVAAASSLGINPPMLEMVQTGLIPDVLEQVQAENYQLKQQVEQMQAQIVELRRDGRGAGN